MVSKSDRISKEDPTRPFTNVSANADTFVKGGVRECEMTPFIQFFVVSRLLYGLPYHSANRTQILDLDRLINEARTLITGLPRFTRLDALSGCGGAIDLSGLVSTHYNI